MLFSARLPVRTTPAHPKGRRDDNGSIDDRSAELESAPCEQVALQTWLLPLPRRPAQRTWKQACAPPCSITSDAVWSIRRSCQQCSAPPRRSRGPRRPGQSKWSELSRSSRPPSACRPTLAAGAAIISCCPLRSERAGTGTYRHSRRERERPLPARCPERQVRQRSSSSLSGLLRALRP